MRMTLGVVLALLAGSAYAQCTKDIECKGDRICSHGACVDAPARAAPAPAGDAPTAEPQLTSPEVRRATIVESMRATRIMQLEREVAELHVQLEDATLGGPIVKLAGGGALAILSIVSFVAWSNANSCVSNSLRGCDNPTTFVSMASISGAAAVVFLIWGGAQLGLRLGERSSLPVEISNREAELKMLRAAR